MSANVPTPPSLEDLERQMAAPSAQSLEDQLAELEAAAASEDFRGAAPAWKPDKEGAFIAGTVMSIFESEGDYGPSNAMVIRKRDGEEQTIYCSQTVLRNQFDRLKPQVGDLVAVKYVGEKSGKNDRKYKDYVMRVERQ